MTRQGYLVDLSERTAFNSPKLFHLAKCPLRLLLDALPATPLAEYKRLETQRARNRKLLGNSGDRQSRIMATSHSTSAAMRYVLHSASIDVPIKYAKAMVANLPVDSRITWTSMAPVGDADESPTPRPG